MLASEIIECIGRRHAKFCERCHPPLTADAGEVDLIDLRIKEEYDSLMTEIEAICRANEVPRVLVPAGVDDPEDRTEEWILGDQGQPGG